MHKNIQPNTVKDAILGFPHCDSRVLHAPGECVYCDHHPVWQALRQVWGICFTGYQPDGSSPTFPNGELPDPATHARGESVNLWHGNVAQPAVSE